MIKDTDFYNKESIVYSEKRYPEIAETYTQFFFKERLRLILEKVSVYIESTRGLRFLEIGCADGVVTRAAAARYGERFASILGIDISPEMIRVAQSKGSGSKMVFLHRSEYAIRKHDVIFEVGVINYAVLKEELEFIATQLSKDGLAVISFAGKGSLWDRRRKTGTGFSNFLSYGEYERKISEQFQIMEKIPVGLPLPLIWRVPSVGRVLQPFVESLVRPIAPGLFHEKIYILRAR